MLKISVIIPCFNVEKYLDKCMESVLEQTLADIEIICINDGSTDNSLDLLNSYAASDKRITVINKKNEGVGIARNTGLKLAAGEYVYFVDPDDWLCGKDVFEKIYEKAKDENLDMLIFGGYSCRIKSGKIFTTRGGYSLKYLPKKYFNRIFSHKDVKDDIFKFPSTTWTKLYKKEFLDKNNILFQTIPVGQDQLPFFHSMITANRIAVLNECLYCYRKNRPNSAMTAKKRKSFSPLFVIEGIEQLLITNGKIEEYNTIFINKYFSKATSWLGKFDKELKEDYFKEYNKTLNHLKKEYPNGWWKYFNPKVKDTYLKLKLKQFIAQKKYSLLK